LIEKSGVTSAGLFFHPMAYPGTKGLTQ